MLDTQTIIVLYVLYCMQIHASACQSFDSVIVRSQYSSQASNLLSLVAMEPHTVSIARRAMEPRHILHSALTCPPSANAWRLKSRHPFVPAAQQLISLSVNNNIRAADWGITNGMRNGRITLRTFIPDTGTHPPGITFPRTAWVRLNRLRTDVGRFRSCMASSAAW